MPYDSIISRTDAAALIPTEQSREILQELPQGSFVMQNARRLPNMTAKQRTMPVLNALPTAYFVNEAPQVDGSDVKQTTEVDWTNVTITAEEIACIVPIPEAVLDDADYDVWGEVRPLIVEAIGRVWDAAVAYGTNAPATWPTDILTAAAAAGNTLALGAGGVDMYDDILGESGVVSLLEADGYMPTGHVAAVTMRGKLRSVRGTDGQPIFSKGAFQEPNVYELDGVRCTFPLNGALAAASSLLISGDWSKLVYAIRQDITYRILTEGVITDTSSPRQILHNLAQDDMVAMRVVFRGGWALPNPPNRVQPVAANRYPFAILTP